jgi:hypothetical protein
MYVALSWYGLLILCIPVKLAFWSENSMYRHWLYYASPWSFIKCSLATRSCRYDIIYAPASGACLGQWLDRLCESIDGYSTVTSFQICAKIINNATASTSHNPHSAFSTTVRKPALGPSFTFLTDATLWLSRICAGGDIYVAEVFRSRTTVGLFQITDTYKYLCYSFKPSKTWCTFGIRQGVLVVGW